MLSSHRCEWRASPHVDLDKRCALLKWHLPAGSVGYEDFNGTHVGRPHWQPVQHPGLVIDNITCIALDTHGSQEGHSLVANQVTVCGKVTVDIQEIYLVQGHLRRGGHMTRHLVRSAQCHGAGPAQFPGHRIAQFHDPVPFVPAQGHLAWDLAVSPCHGGLPVIQLVQYLFHVGVVSWFEMQAQRAIFATQIRRHLTLNQVTHIAVLPVGYIIPAPRVMKPRQSHFVRALQPQWGRQLHSIPRSRVLWIIIHARIRREC